MTYDPTNTNNRQLTHKLFPNASGDRRRSKGGRGKRTHMSWLFTPRKTYEVVVTCYKEGSILNNSCYLLLIGRY